MIVCENDHFSRCPRSRECKARQEDDIESVAASEAKRRGTLDHRRRLVRNKCSRIKILLQPNERLDRENKELAGHNYHRRYGPMRHARRMILLLLLNHTPWVYDSAWALRLCGPSTHFYYTALRPDKKLKNCILQLVCGVCRPAS